MIKDNVVTSIYSVANVIFSCPSLLLKSILPRVDGVMRVIVELFQVKIKDGLGTTGHSFSCDFMA